MMAPNPRTDLSQLAAGVFVASTLRRGAIPHPTAPSTCSHPGLIPPWVAQGKPIPPGIFWGGLRDKAAPSWLGGLRDKAASAWLVGVT